MNLFELAGIAPVKDEPKAKSTTKSEATKKEPSKNSPKKGDKTTKGSNNTLKVPVTVKTGWYSDVSYTADAFGGKEAGITAEEVVKVMLRDARFEYLKGAKTYREDDNTLYVGTTETTVPVCDVTPATRVFCGTKWENFTEEVQKLLVDENGIPVEKKTLKDADIVNACLPQGIGGKCVVLSDGNIVILPGVNQVTGTVKLPFTMTTYLNGEVKIASEDIKKFRSTQAPQTSEEPEEPEDGEEDGDTETTETVGAETEILQVSVEELEKYLASRYKTFSKALKIYSNGDKLKELYTIRFVVPSAAAKFAAPKEVKYNIEKGVTLHFAEFGEADKKLTPADFGGKTEIEKKDVFAYIAEDYPEFSETNSVIDFFESSTGKESWLTIRRKSGSTKG